MAILSEDERRRILQAVSNAEAKSGAEIVPVVALESSAYRFAVWRTSAYVLGMGTLAAILIPHDLAPWLQIIIAFVPALLVSALLLGFPSIRLCFLSEEEISHQVESAALVQYYHQDLGETKDKTGVLVYLSLREKRASVVPDHGILQRLEMRRWHEIARRIEKYLDLKDQVRAMVEGLQMIGRLLEGEIPRRPDDENELPDLIEVRDGSRPDSVVT